MRALLIALALAAPLAACGKKGPMEAPAGASSPQTPQPWDKPQRQDPGEIPPKPKG